MTQQLEFEARSRLLFGDNLEVLRRHVADESVDLVYLDPPFKSNKSYNVLFAHKDGRLPAAQVKAFDDTWRWDQASAALYQEMVESGGPVSRVLRAFREFLGTSDMLAYLSMMAPRLVELRRVMKPTGSLYLHCDPTASHYLKMLLDAVFGPELFLNEIVWKRTSGRKGKIQYGRVHDVILFYARSSKSPTWNPPMVKHQAGKAKGHDLITDSDGTVWRSSDLSGAGQGPPRVFGDRGEIAPPRGRHWQYDQEGIDRLWAEGRIIFSSGGRPRLKNPVRGVAVTDVWTDIEPVNAAAAERLRYPTQKPVALMERIISASSNEGDVVLDPFCGCGTSIEAAERLGRRWIGIDITTLAIGIIQERLYKQFGTDVDYILRGEPSSMDEATALAEHDKHEFQRWACQRLGIEAEVRKGADRGIDGEIVGTYADGAAWRGIVSVKGGRVGVRDVRDLKGTISREHAEFGIIVTLKPPTGPMKREVADAGFSESGSPVLQIITVEELLAGQRVDLPDESARSAQRRLRAV